MRALVLDWDGVLARFDRARAHEALCAHLPFELDELGARIRAYESRLGSPRGARAEREFWLGFVGNLAEELGLDDHARSQLSRFDPREILERFPDAPEALHRARGRGLQIGVLSNFTLLDLPMSLAAIGVDDLVDLALSAATIGAAKPDPAAYLAMTRALGLEPNQCAFVDDRLEHITGATQVGMTAVLLARRPDTRSGALGGLDELDDWLDRQLVR